MNVDAINSVVLQKRYTVGKSLVSFFVAFEKLYEVHDTILMERIRGRGSVKLRTQAQFKLLIMLYAAARRWKLGSTMTLKSTLTRRVH